MLAVSLALPLAALLCALPAGRTPAAASSARRLALRALVLTLRTTLVATLLCVAARARRSRSCWRAAASAGRDVLDTLVDLPITIPPVVAGVALLLAFGRRGLLGRHLDVMGSRSPSPPWPW